MDISNNSVADSGLGGEFVHMAALYRSEAELCSRAGPYLEEGLSRGESVLAVLSTQAEEILRDFLGPEAKRIQWGSESEISYDRLGSMNEKFRAFLAAQQSKEMPTRIMGEYDYGSSAHRLSHYLEYESMCNETYAPYESPVLCLWNERDYDEDVLIKVRQVHPFLVGNQGRIRSEAYCEPADFLSRGLAVPIEVQKNVDFDLQVCGKSDLSSLRHHLHAWARLYAYNDLDSFILAINEIVTNALWHGKPPAQIRGWTNDNSLIIEVRDSGSAAIDPSVGFRLPPLDATSGRGVWFARQVADVVTVTSSPNSTSVILTFPLEIGS